ncbi:MAG: sulfite exporter TauE/SafE family protein [Sulfitobacter sp.]
MESLFPFLTTNQLFLALFIALCGGFVKGVVGFAMPLVLISGLTFFIAPEVALAGLILPTLVSNVMQSLRQGPAAAWQSIRLFKVFLIAGGLTLVIAAQLVRIASDDVLSLIIGVPVVVFVVLQLTGYQFRIEKKTVKLEAFAGGFAGIMAGMSGVWGPPTVTYLTALNTQKYDQMRIQGVIYGLGSVALAGAHIGSGVLRAETWPFSAALILPGLVGMWIGGKVMDRIDQKLFRRATLIVLLLAGANLVRRAVF